MKKIKIRNKIYLLICLIFFVPASYASGPAVSDDLHDKINKAKAQNGFHEVTPDGQTYRTHYGDIMDYTIQYNEQTLTAQSVTCRIEAPDYAGQNGVQMGYSNNGLGAGVILRFDNNGMYRYYVFNRYSSSDIDLRVNNTHSITFTIMAPKTNPRPQQFPPKFLIINSGCSPKDDPGLCPPGDNTYWGEALLNVMCKYAN